MVPDAAVLTDERMAREAPCVRLVRIRQASGSRTLAVLEPATRDRYVELVAGVAEAVERTLSPRVVANRVAFASVDPPELRLRPWRLERRAFAARLTELAGRAEALAFADVRRCYPSIRPSVVGEALRRLGLPTAPEIEGFLRRLGREGVRGLPVGPKASSVLANLVLAHVDRALERAGIEHLRWVDDVVVAAARPAEALEVVRRALAEVGLALNGTKTRVLAVPHRMSASLSGPGRASAG